MSLQIAALERHGDQNLLRDDQVYHLGSELEDRVPHSLGPRGEQDERRVRRAHPLGRSMAKGVNLAVILSRAP